MLILNMYSMNKLYQYRIFPVARLLGPPTILYFPLIFPHARLFGTLLLLGTLEYVPSILKISILFSQTQKYTFWYCCSHFHFYYFFRRLKSQFCGLGGNLPIFVGRHFWIIGSSSR